MRVGHGGVALAAKRLAPAVPVWLLLGAAYGPDIIEVVLRVFGQLDRELSHSLVSIGIVATLTAAGYAVMRRDWRDAAIVWLVYVLHWPADFITGNKPTWPGGPTVGLNLYDHRVLVWVVDLAVLGAGWWFYHRRSPARTPNGTKVTSPG